MLTNFGDWLEIDMCFQNWLVILHLHNVQLPTQWYRRNHTEKRTQIHWNEISATCLQ